MKAFLDLLTNGIVGSFFNTELPMLILCYVITALAAYCLGSLNFAVIISKLKHHDDIRKYGSGNAGMTNMLRTYGKVDAALTFLGDALKTAVSIVIGMLLVGAVSGGNYVAGFFAILGHVYPCYYRFKGGKGVVASAITILMLDWQIFLILLAAFVIIVAIWRYISLGSVVCAMLYPMLVYAKQQVGLEKAVEENMPVFYSAVPITFAFIIALFIVILHKTNIERLMTGKESKIGSKSKKQQKFSVSKDDKK
ncbi:MAG: glycerol-3-phosphate 1-O-acyltransferase PlsY [Clostridia bacterium]|nr:glycerol-3-phosphate 1-O-acyltransferase PlsY [Clostridia bacterium]